MSIRAIFFDVDFTLIHPGPAFQGSGYAEACARHGVVVDPLRFAEAVAAASSALHVTGGEYDPAVFIEYTCRIIEAMGGTGDGVAAAARDLYDAWPSCHHFTLYEEVPDVLRELRDEGYTIGLISNTQRSLAEFERHFALEGLFSVAISSSDHGYMKPHPSIFEEGLRRARVSADQAVMVGDSVAHDIEGARRLGMRGILVARSGLSTGAPADVPVIQTLRELRDHL
ncbi:MAG TPA: HAD family hydrolase [Vicinamibacterales bacterium]|jgi:putative hydrolase of the HAD superfamily|nr:HAD family hydrolase [Vicinamibacterales bacterium]